MELATPYIYYNYFFEKVLAISIQFFKMVNENNNICYLLDNLMISELFSSKFYKHDEMKHRESQACNIFIALYRDESLQSTLQPNVDVQANMCEYKLCKLFIRRLVSDV